MKPALDRAADAIPPAAAALGVDLAVEQIAQGVPAALAVDLDAEPAVPESAAVAQVVLRHVVEMDALANALPHAALVVLQAADLAVEAAMEPAHMSTIPTDKGGNINGYLHRF